MEHHIIEFQNNIKKIDDKNFYLSYYDDGYYYCNYCDYKCDKQNIVNKHVKDIHNYDSYLTEKKYDCNKLKEKKNLINKKVLNLVNKDVVETNMQKIYELLYNYNIDDILNYHFFSKESLYKINRTYHFNINSLLVHNILAYDYRLYLTYYNFQDILINKLYIKTLNYDIFINNCYKDLYLPTTSLMSFPLDIKYNIDVNKYDREKDNIYIYISTCHFLSALHIYIRLTNCYDNIIPSGKMYANTKILAEHRLKFYNVLKSIFTFYTNINLYKAYNIFLFYINYVQVKYFNETNKINEYQKILDNEKIIQIIEQKIENKINAYKLNWNGQYSSQYNIYTLNNFNIIYYILEHIYDDILIYHTQEGSPKIIPPSTSPAKSSSPKKYSSPSPEIPEFILPPTSPSKSSPIKNSSPSPEIIPPPSSPPKSSPIKKSSQSPEIILPPSSPPKSSQKSNKRKRDSKNKSK